MRQKMALLIVALCPILTVYGASSAEVQVAEEPVIPHVGSVPDMMEDGLINIPENSEIEDAVPVGSSLTGREIFEHFADNEMHSAVQHQRVVSTDPGGSKQTTRFWVRWKDFRDEDRKSVDGVFAKGVVKFSEPLDLRGTGFLLIINDGRDPDQFVYQPSSRRVRRVNLRDVGLAGTDVTFGDVAVNNLDQADYARLADSEIEGVPVYVVEVTVKPFVDVDYRTSIAYIEKEHYIPLRQLYKDENGVLIRESAAVPSSLRQFDGIWIATETTTTNVRKNTSTTTTIERLEANPELSDALFSTFRLGLRRDL